MTARKIWLCVNIAGFALLMSNAAFASPHCWYVAIGGMSLMVISAFKIAW